MNLFHQFVKNHEHNIEILTLNFEIKKIADELNIKNDYLDRMIPPSKMKELNTEVSAFLESWFKNDKSEDLFQYKGINFGRSFLLNIWSEIIFQSRLIVNINSLHISSETLLFVDSSLNDVIDILIRKEVKINVLTNQEGVEEPSLYFDISKYMHEALSQEGIKNRLRNLLLHVSNQISTFLRLIARKHEKDAIYLQVYHPTLPVIEELLRKETHNVITNSAIGRKGLKKYFTGQRILAIRGSKRRHLKEASDLIENFIRIKLNSHSTGNYDDSIMPDYLLEKIIVLIRNDIAIALSSIDKIVEFNRKVKLVLYVSISNLGIFETILDEYCRIHAIPRFLIINGFLTNDHYIDSRSGDFFNCYSESIKMNFYKNSRNAIPLGDPRMDKYFEHMKRKVSRNTSEKDEIVIGIGTAGYNNVDLLSYLAFEFEFLNGILGTLQRIDFSSNKQIKVKLRVRSNGFSQQYKYFLETYYPDLRVIILKNEDFITFAENLDLYISTYSQTLFEAATLGIPVIYFKKDQEFLDPPFDGKSELLTAANESELFELVGRALNDESGAFATLDLQTIEKYFGYVDGRNLNRNIDFIHEILEKGRGETSVPSN